MAIAQDRLLAEQAGVHRTMIDVLLPVRNGARYLPAALDSLAAQTFTGFRVLACDDGSTDATPALLRAERRFELVYFRHEHGLGLAASLNRLLAQLGAARYVARFDADDLCRPDRFEQQVRFLDAHPQVDIVGSWLSMIDENGQGCGRLRYPTEDDAIRFEFVFQDALAHPALMMRREVFDAPEARYDASYEPADDYELWCRLARTVRFANIPQELLQYRVHASSTSATRRAVQQAASRRLRIAYIHSLQLREQPTRALLSALELAPPRPAWRGRDARELTKALRTRFPSGSRSVEGRKWMDGLIRHLFVRMPAVEKLRWMLREPRIAALYLGDKLGRRPTGPSP